LTVQATPRVLISYDGSPGAATAVRAAAGLFPTARASVVTVPEVTVQAEPGFPGLSAMSPELVRQVIDQLGAEARRQAGETAQQAVDRARALGLQAEVLPVDPSAPAWAALLDAAHRVGADVLACGTRGRGAFARALLGSTSSRLLHHTDVPLLVVPDGGGALDGPVVAAYDGSQGATRAIEVVGRLLSGRPAVVVHAWEPVFHRSLVARALAAADPGRPRRAGARHCPQKRLNDPRPSGSRQSPPDGRWCTRPRDTAAIAVTALVLDYGLDLTSDRSARPSREEAAPGATRARRPTGAVISSPGHSRHEARGRRRRRWRDGRRAWPPLRWHGRS
jgi:nucleotide-binding universal stress UspA family protein